MRYAEKFPKFPKWHFCPGSSLQAARHFFLVFLQIDWLGGPVDLQKYFFLLQAPQARGAWAKAFWELLKKLIQLGKFSQFLPFWGQKRNEIRRL
jgi:hypothetical protein